MLSFIIRFLCLFLGGWYMHIFAKGVSLPFFGRKVRNVNTPFTTEQFINLIDTYSSFCVIAGGEIFFA